MFCSKCGEELPENVHICAKCSGTLQEKNTALNESGLTEGGLNQEVKDNAFEIRNPKKRAA